MSGGIEGGRVIEASPGEPEAAASPAAPSEESGLSDLLQYLSLVQSIVDRMANSALAVKAACVAVVVGMLAVLPTPDLGRLVACSAIIAAACVAFSLLDARYLQQERCYRGLYERVAEARRLEGLSLCCPSPSREAGSLFSRCYFSWSVLGFYACVLVGAVLVRLACM